MYQEKKFIKFCEYKGVKLTNAQINRVRDLVNSPSGTGRTMLINLLKEYDDGNWSNRLADLDK